MGISVNGLQAQELGRSGRLDSLAGGLISMIPIKGDQGVKMNGAPASET
jgi:hypothetical protein